MRAYPEGESVWHTIHDALPHMDERFARFIANARRRVVTTQV
jgi:hypothetical protein